VAPTHNKPPSDKAAQPGVGAAGPTVARSQAYLFLGRTFAFPSQAFFDDVIGGRWQEQATDFLPRLPFAAPPLAGDPPTVSCDDFQAEYNRLFEVGTMGGPPCPLLGGFYDRDRMRVMEELIRFYNYFGLGLAQGQLPDHITVEMEFMHYLTYKEAEAQQIANGQESYQRAQKDFLDRHLGKWVPVLRQKLAKCQPLPFFDGLVAWTEDFLGRDRQYLKSVVSPSPF
jgi:DMSO reductase family type II enzyme chaperone